MTRPHDDQAPALDLEGAEEADTTSTTSGTRRLLSSNGAAVPLVVMGLSSYFFVVRSLDHTHVVSESGDCHWRRRLQL
mgnify:CR=1 FL=1